MREDASRLFCPINPSLGRQPSLGPMPAHLMAPSGIILVTTYVLVNRLLTLGFPTFLLLSAWGIATWWVVVGEKTWTFTNKFVAVPNWKRGYVPYRRHLTADHE